MKSAFIKKLKPWMLPIAMLLGVVFHNYIGQVAFLSKYLIFMMLLITFTRVTPRNIKPDKSMLWLLLIQIGGAVAVYYALRWWSEDVAQSAFICVFCPTATAAPVITGMLGGSVEKVAAYSLLSNLVVALTAPLLLAYINENAGISFFAAMSNISINVLPLILGPLAVALILRGGVPKLHSAIANHQSLSFYIWAISLIIVVGNAVSFVMREPASMVPEMVVMGVVSFILCVGQFYLGRKVGAKYGDRIAAAQSLGQKNTVLAIWLALTYLNPVASVGPACYIAWHNSVNSYQIYRKSKKG